MTPLRSRQAPAQRRPGRFAALSFSRQLARAHLYLCASISLAGSMWTARGISVRRRTCFRFACRSDCLLRPQDSCIDAQLQIDNPRFRRRALKTCRLGADHMGKSARQAAHRGQADLFALPADEVAEPAFEIKIAVRIRFRRRRPWRWSAAPPGRCLTGLRRGRWSAS